MATVRASHAPADALGRSVDATLQSYADRGVFRGFSAEDARGTRRYRFTWLARRPVTATFTRSTSTLSFTQLFPAVTGTPGLVTVLREDVQRHTTGAVPVHRRLDRRRAQVVAVVRGGDLSLRVVLKGRDASHGVRSTLALVNDLFLLLQERYPEYLVAHFGFKDE